MHAQENPLSSDAKIALAAGALLLGGIGIYLATRPASAAAATPGSANVTLGPAYTFTPGHRYSISGPLPSGTQALTVAAVQTQFNAFGSGALKVQSVSTSGGTLTIIVDCISQPALQFRPFASTTITDLGPTPAGP